MVPVSLREIEMDGVDGVDIVEILAINQGRQPKIISIKLKDLRIYPPAGC